MIDLRYLNDYEGQGVTAIELLDPGTTRGRRVRYILASWFLQTAEW